MEKEVYYLWLILVTGEADPRAAALLQRFGSARAVYDAFAANTAAAGADAAARAGGISLDDAEKLLSGIREKGIKVITREDALYPEALKRAVNPPCLLFARGNTSLLRKNIVCTAGSRNMTAQTAGQIDIIVGGLRDYCIASSLTDGCDQQCCLSAIRRGVPFIEIMPCGVLKSYPQGSRTLREYMLARGGLCISELLPETKPSNANFVRRKRIIGGFSPATLIFQAGRDSGALAVAEMAHRALFLPPRDIFRKEYSGAAIAVRKGAGLFFGIPDIEKAYSLFSSGSSQAGALRFTRKKTGKRRTKDAPAELSPTTGKEKRPADIKPEELESQAHYDIYRLIADSETPVPDIILADRSGLDRSSLDELILDLEISGLIICLPGNRYAVC